MAVIGNLKGSAGSVAPRSEPLVVIVADIPQLLFNADGDVICIFV